MLRALLRLGAAALVDARRVLVLRTASDYTMPHANMSAAQGYFDPCPECAVRRMLFARGRACCSCLRRQPNARPSKLFTNIGACHTARAAGAAFPPHWLPRLP